MAIAISLLKAIESIKKATGKTLSFLEKEFPGTAKIVKGTIPVVLVREIKKKTPLPQALKTAWEEGTKMPDMTPEEWEEAALIFTPGAAMIGGLARKVAPKVIPKAEKAVPKAIEKIITRITKPPTKPQLKVLSKSPALNGFYEFWTTKVVKPTKEIAIRLTKGGKAVPAIRTSGVSVSPKFANTTFKDAKVGIAGGTKDITRYLQEADLGIHGGQLQQKVLWKTRDIIKHNLNWSGEKINKITGIIKNVGIKKGSKEAKLANRVLEKISVADSKLPAAELITKKSISSITTDTKIVELARKSRTYFDDMLKEQNIFRKLRGQKAIPHRAYYSPQQLQKQNLWSELFGLKKEPADIFKAVKKGKPPLPDYIFPDKPFNPFAEARKFGLKAHEREMDLISLMEKYTQTASRDIFNTSIVQNNKAFIQQLESMGYPNLSRGIQDWTAESFLGVGAKLDRAMNFSKNVTQGMNWWRSRLVRNVFPLNFAWNMFVQTSSITLTGTRYGLVNTAKGAVKWFTSPAYRKSLMDKGVYSFIVKSQKVGKITYQDINAGVNKAVALERKPLQKAVDAMNYFTEWTERQLTGISVAAGEYHGTKLGLKGKSLVEYMSDAGAKTQSMYNLEDLPGILRSNLVKTAAPFQTFSFEVFNTMREFAGKTGLKPVETNQRIKWVLRFLSGAVATNMVSQEAIGRRLWDANAFLPFYGSIVSPMIGKTPYETTRGLPPFAGAARQLFVDGLSNIMSKDPNKVKKGKKKIRQVFVKYGSPVGGIQINRVIDGIQAIADGGVYDSAGRMQFPILDTKEKMRALLAGPWSTKAGKEYIEKRK